MTVTYHYTLPIYFVFIYVCQCPLFLNRFSRRSSANFPTFKSQIKIFSSNQSTIPNYSYKYVPKKKKKFWSTSMTDSLYHIQSIAFVFYGIIEKIKLIIINACTRFKKLKDIFNDRKLHTFFDR